jgi:CheY-like chemotaxis protein
VSADSGRPLILVADDDEDMLELACVQLEDAGYRVERAADGEQALRMTRELRPDLCVLDVVMPGLCGHEVLRELRADPDTEKIPVLLLTATLEQRALWRLGPRPDECMAKQEIGTHLEERVRAMLEAVAAETAPARAAASG